MFERYILCILYMYNTRTTTWLLRLERVRMLYTVSVEKGMWKCLDIISFEWLCVWRFYALYIVNAYVFRLHTHTHTYRHTRIYPKHIGTLSYTYSFLDPLPNKLLQMWHFHDSIKMSKVQKCEHEQPKNQTKPNKNTLQTNGRSIGWLAGWMVKWKWNRNSKTHTKTENILCWQLKHNLDAALMVKQQLPVMYWFWCWLIQMPDADHMQRTNERCNSGQFPMHPLNGSKQSSASRSMLTIQYEINLVF